MHIISNDSISCYSCAHLYNDTVIELNALFKTSILKSLYKIHCHTYTKCLHPRSKLFYVVYGNVLFRLKLFFETINFQNIFCLNTKIISKLDCVLYNVYIRRWSTFGILPGTIPFISVAFLATLDNKFYVRNQTKCFFVVINKGTQTYNSIILWNIF